jgi:hypothetical protein
VLSFSIEYGVIESKLNLESRTGLYHTLRLSGWMSASKPAGLVEVVGTIAIVDHHSRLDDNGPN